jgi:L-amino acid N-acyltransferase YncA
MEKNRAKDFILMNQNNLQIREAGISDLPGITEIYNEAVLNGVATFDTEIKSIDNRREWLAQHGGKHQRSRITWPTLFIIAYYTRQ